MYDKHVTYNRYMHTEKNGRLYISFALIITTIARYFVTQFEKR